MGFGEDTKGTKNESKIQGMQETSYKLQVAGCKIQDDI